MSTEAEIIAEIEELGRLTEEQEDILYNIALRQEELGRQPTIMLREKVDGDPIYQPMIDREVLTYQLYNHGGAGSHEVVNLIVTLKGMRYVILHSDELSRAGRSILRAITATNSRCSIYVWGDKLEITDITRESDDAVQEMVVTMTASAAEVNDYIEKQFKELAKNEIPGFRKGKAPREVIEREAGGHDVVFARIAEAIVNGEAPALLDDADVLFIGDPQFNLEKIPAKDQPFTFTISGPVPPEGTLSSYDEVSIEMPPNEATEAEIETQIDELLSVYYNYDVIDDPDYEVEDGDYVTVRMTIMNDGAVIPGLNDVERMLSIGGGSMPESFDEHVIGSKKGYTLDFDFDAQGKEERPSSETASFTPTSRSWRFASASCPSSTTSSSPRSARRASMICASR